MNVIDFYKKITGENKKEKQELKVTVNNDNTSSKSNGVNPESRQLKRPSYTPSKTVGFNHPVNSVEATTTTQVKHPHTESLKVEPIKTENIKKQVVGVVNYLKSSTCIVLSENNNKHTLTINNIEEFDFEDSAINEKWHKLLKNHLFNKLKTKNDKIIAYIDNGKVDIYFDYDRKQSLLNEIKVLHNDYKEKLMSMEEKGFLSKTQQSNDNGVKRAFNPRDMGN